VTLDNLSGGTARAVKYGNEPRMTPLRLAGVVLGAAALACAVVGMRAARSELASAKPTHHAVPLATGDASLDSATEINLRTPKGVVFRGWLRGSTNGAAVLFVHGSDTDRRQLLPEAHTLSAAGYGVLLFDRPGSGESGGQKFGEDEADFLRVAVDTLASDPSLRPGGLGAYGFSSGAAYLAEAAGADARLHGVVLAGCYTDDDEYIRHFRGRGPLSGWPSLWAVRWAGHLLPHPLAMVPKIAPRALFFIVGDEDPTVPPEMSSRLYAAASEPKQLWIIEGAGHGDYAQVAGPEYSRRLVAFFDRALLERDGSR
jgi:pimeloyl-ACP methyl ester carboxylesterase